MPRAELTHAPNGWTVTGDDGSETLIFMPLDATPDAAIELVASMNQPATEPTPEDMLAAERRGMTCSRMQGMLALGQARWAEVLAYRNSATWAEQVIIDGAGDWHRLSQNIAFFAYLLDLSDTQVDDLFRAAREIVA